MASGPFLTCPEAALLPPPRTDREGKQRTNNNNGVSCECECPRKLRISQTAFEEGPIVVCAVCSAAFLPEDIDRDTYEHPTFATGTQASDGQANDDSKDDDPMVFYDPTGERYGLPTYPFKLAPSDLLTRRQLRAHHLRPDGQDPAAQILWRRGKRVAYLYRLDLAMPKRTATPPNRRPSPKRSPRGVPARTAGRSSPTTSPAVPAPASTATEPKGQPSCSAT